MHIQYNILQISIIQQLHRIETIHQIAFPLMVPLNHCQKTSKQLLYSIGIIKIINFCLAVISLFATKCTLIRIRKSQYQRITTRKYVNDHYFYLAECIDFNFKILLTF